MDTTSVWQMLANIKVGTLVAWGIVLVAIITTTVRGIKNVYSFISKYKDMKEINEKQSEMLDAHEKALDDIKQSLQKISDSLEEQRQINLEYTRHMISNACLNAIDAKKIPAEALQSIEDMYKQYVTVFNGNSYVCNLVKHVRTLPIIKSSDKEG